MKAQVLRCALLGDPVAASLSPFIHQEGAARQGHSLEYALIQCTRNELEQKLEGLHQQGYVGINLTHPLKESAWSRLRDHGPTAACGSANWLERRPEGWRAHSSDGAGFRAALEKWGAPNQLCIAGSGGVVRSILPELLRRWPACRVSLRARRKERARRMLAELGLELPLFSWNELPEDADVLVNATPLGMREEQSLPFPLEALKKRPLCFDLVSVPQWTPWLRAAKAAGCRTLHGREMLLQQAAPAFYAWTGKKLPLEELRSLLQARQQLREAHAAGKLRGPILLLGFMGAGKTSSGRELAHLLEWPFLDLDEELQRRTGRTPAQWIRQAGEAAFREQEAQLWSVLSREWAGQGIVIAAGGGLPLAPGFFQTLRRQAYCIFLDLPARQLLERLKADRERPLLQDRNEAQRLALIEQRSALYARAEFRLKAEAGSPKELAARILTTLAPAIEEASS